MPLHPDWKEFLQLLNSHSAASRKQTRLAARGLGAWGMGAGAEARDYLIVGAHSTGRLRICSYRDR